MGTDCTAITGTDNLDFAVTMQPLHGQQAIRFYTAGGTEICNLVGKGDHVDAVPAPSAAQAVVIVELRAVVAKPQARVAELER